jgi:dipeptidyl aminopeptidase/acylaminoacyl peptidase
LFIAATSNARGDDGALLTRQPLAEFSQAGVAVERIVYESDGLRVLGFLGYADSAPRAERPLPCVIFNRGGNRDFGAWTPERFASFARRVAAWGYVLLAPNYRGSAGSEGADEFGGADVNDVLNAIKVLENLDFADDQRIGMWGHSRGGMMTYLALARTDRISAAIVGAGPADLARMIQLRPEMESVLAECVPNWADRRDDALASRSALRWVEELPSHVPVLLAHGTADWRVDPRDSLDLAAALLKAKKPYRLIMFEGADHGVSEFQDEYDAAVHMWLDKYVRDKQPPPNLEPHGR